MNKPNGLELPKLYVWEYQDLGSAAMRTGIQPLPDGFTGLFVYLNKQNREDKELAYFEDVYSTGDKYSLGYGMRGKKPFIMVMGVHLKVWEYIQEFDRVLEKLEDKSSKKIPLRQVFEATIKRTFKSVPC